MTPARSTTETRRPPFEQSNLDEHVRFLDSRRHGAHGNDLRWHHSQPSNASSKSADWLQPARRETTEQTSPPGEQSKVSEISGSGGPCPADTASVAFQIGEFRVPYIGGDRLIILIEIEASNFISGQFRKESQGVLSCRDPLPF